MSKTNVTLTITTQGEGELANSSTSTIQTDSLAELKRLLDLAGMSSGGGTPAPGAEVLSDMEEDAEYKAPASNQVRMPDQKINNPRHGDNSLAEEFGDEDAEMDITPMGAFDAVDPQFVADTFHNFLAVTDQEEALARTAEEFGMTGEEVQELIDNVDHFDDTEDLVSEDFDDYNQVEPREAPPEPKGLRDYLPSDFGSEREVQVKAKAYNVTVEFLDGDYNSHIPTYRIEAEGQNDARRMAVAQAEKEAKAKGLRFTLVDAEAELEESVDEAYGYRKSKYEQDALDRQYAATAALLPIERMMVTVDQLGDNEYFGKNLMKGDTSIVCFAIETNSKPRLTFASTYGSIDEWKPGMKVLTFHDQSGAERPATVVTAFTGTEWSSPEGREAIKSRMAKGGMDPNKKYSVRVFK